MSIDLAPLWDFSNPALSETRFRSELAHATGDDAIILETQIARTYGLRRDFARAQTILASLEPVLPTAGPEARVRHCLELARSIASATHPAETQTLAAREQARSLFLRAFQLATTSGLDGLAIDALHMLAFVDTVPTDQLEWGRQALAIAQSSSQPAAQAWEPSLRNNLGCALHQLGRYDEALKEFHHALELRERVGNANAIRTARWMVAWTLRSLGRLDEALETQLQLERECDAAGAPDPYVYRELELLYRGQNNEALASHYAKRRSAVEQC